MRRIAIMTLSVLFLAAGMAACGKTNTRKMDNDWKVTSYYDETVYVSTNGDVSKNTVSMTESTVTQDFVATPSSGPVATNSRSGSVKIHEWNIKKDGTWSSVQEITFPTGISSYTNRLEQSGTWSFLSKTKGGEFGKNERVHFNVLLSKGLETMMTGQTVDLINSSEVTYLTGEEVMVYTIKSSTKDALEMELENSYTLTQTSGNDNSNSLVRKITLQGK